MKNERPAVQILEESINLLRASPQALVIYLAGAIPFTLALLVFLNDMFFSPYAPDHLAAASLGLAALYVWKNTMQAIFAARLYQTLSPNEARPLKIVRSFLVQCTLQPIGLAVPLPLPWLTAFFRNVALFAAIGDPHAIRSARRQAILWTRQTWAILSIVTIAYLLLFVNLLAVIALLPQLARSLLGVEGDFARMGNHILYKTTMGCALALAWMAVDPVLDAVFVLRCFYGESIATGEDLRAGFQRALQRAAAALLVVALLFVPISVAHAQSNQNSISPGDLNRSIEDVIHSREFTWRVPHPVEEPQGRWASWIRSAKTMVDRFFRAVAQGIYDWLFGQNESSTEGGESPATKRVLKMLIGLVAALIVGAAIVFFMRRRRSATQAVAVTAAAPAIDLADESLTADQLPESSWLQLANEWLEKGDCRLALRALHLAGLNYLGERNLVSIRRWKSGLDYRREVERRARMKPELAPAFSANVDLFERGWYGPRTVDREMVESFVAGLNQIRNSVGTTNAR